MSFENGTLDFPEFESRDDQSTKRNRPETGFGADEETSDEERDPLALETHEEFIRRRADEITAAQELESAAEAAEEAQTPAVIAEGIVERNKQAAETEWEEKKNKAFRRLSVAPSVKDARRVAKGEKIEKPAPSQKPILNQEEMNELYKDDKYDNLGAEKSWHKRHDID